MGQVDSKPPPGGDDACYASYGSRGGGGGGGSSVDGGSGDGDDGLIEFGNLVWEKRKDGTKVELGRGKFGTVYAGRLHGQRVAIKVEWIGDADEAATWTKAVELHMRAACPYVVLVYATVAVPVPRTVSRTARYIVMERLAGTMTELLLKPESAHHDADLVQRLQLLADVAAGLAYLHSISVIHADVKPDNVLMTASMHAKLADLGLSVQRFASSGTPHSALRDERGTLPYMDPCMLDGSGSITTASDVYSFGIMAWQVLSGRVPYKAEVAAAAPANMEEAVKMLKAHVCGPRGKRPPVAVLVERGVPPVVVAQLQRCCAPAQKSRPIMAEVYSTLAAAVTAAPLTYTWSGRSVVLSGHDAAVRAFALLEGGTLASGDIHGVVRLWDAAHGRKATAVLDGHGGAVTALASLSSGRHLAVSVQGFVCSIVVWDMGVVPPVRHATIDCDSGVRALTLLRDGRLVAGCVDGGVRLIEVGAGAGAVTATLEGHTHVVVALAVLPGGTLASGSWDKTVRLWDMDAAECVATLAEHTGAVNALAVLSDGRLASGSDDESIRLWDVATRACVGVLKGHNWSVCSLAVLSDGRLASGSDDKTICVWDTRPTAAAGGAGAAATAAGTGTGGGVPVMVLEGHAHWVRALLPLSGGRLASGSWDHTVCLWNLPSPHRHEDALFYGTPT